MIDDLDRECCTKAEAIIMRGLGLRHDKYSENDAWEIVKRDLHDPGMTLYLKHNLGPKVQVTISYNWDSD